VATFGDSATAKNLAGSYQQFAAKAHAAGIVVNGTPSLPFNGNSYDTAEHWAALTAYDSGDHLRPYPTGYQRMAEAVDRCLFAQ
jgi:hypothetical protein